jgi:hypothetical protein
VLSENPASKGGARKGSAKNHPHSRRDRDEYPVCGPAARAALAKASPTASRFELRVLNGVVSLTALYSKLWDYVSVSQVAAVAYGIPVESVQGYQRDRTTAALRSLAERHIIEYSPGRGRGSQPRVGLPTGTQQDDCWIQDGNPRRFRRETHVDSVAKPTSIPSRNPAPWAGTPRRSSEKVFREDFSEGKCFAKSDDLIAARLADNIDGHSYTEWLEYVDMLRAENIADTVIDEVAGQTIKGVLAGHIHSPRGYFLTTARDWFKQRTRQREAAAEWLS